MPHSDVRGWKSPKTRFLDYNSAIWRAKRKWQITVEEKWISLQKWSWCHNSQRFQNFWHTRNSLGLIPKRPPLRAQNLKKWPPWQLWLGKKKQHKHKLFGANFLRTSLTLTSRWPEVKKFPLSLGPQENSLSGADVHKTFGVDVHDPKGFWKTLSSRSLRWFSGPYYCHLNKYRAQDLFLGINLVILSPPDLPQKKFRPQLIR